VPDVTVVVAVYNTMPYLQECLDSLLAQSIGHDRMQVVAVDDGSTDGSGELLDRYADDHPDVFQVLHQANSGGPANPSNRALERAEGRYVYFLGADDHLGAEALERMVGYADEHDSDVVVGKMVGVNGRHVGQGLFAGGNVPDLDPYGPGLRWALANTKLFRRELLDKHHLRYREDMPFGSDQPFTIAACTQARRISVLADYTCYYAVKRDDASNMSYKTPYAARVPCIGTMMAAVAEHVPAGEGRDTLLTRHWAWEVPRLLRFDLTQHPREEQEQVCAGIAALAEEYLNDAILAQIPVSARVRVGAAARRDVDLLAEVIRDDGDRLLPVRLDADGAAYATYAGLDDGALPASTYRLAPAGVTERLSTAAQLRSCTFTDKTLRVEAFVPVQGPGLDKLSASVRRLGSTDQRQATLTLTPEARGNAVRIDVPLTAMLGEGTGTWRVQLEGSLGRSPGNGGFQVRLPVPVAAPLRRLWRGPRPFRVSVGGTPRENALALHITSISGREVAAAVRRRVRPTKESS
jgi:hypothetical protein